MENLPAIIVIGALAVSAYFGASYYAQKKSDANKVWYASSSIREWGPFADRERCENFVASGHFENMHYFDVKCRAKMTKAEYSAMMDSLANISFPQTRYVTSKSGRVYEVEE